ncbi:mesoderm induction early response protein 1-like isoform X1 [Culicoides brevitarsis]|uniref:mesoderm induction early response protein 1-like isoform X1 n=1 Tax=Culicoides brevitarsis TaxID=469753 RepID=UPI00307C2AE3
MSSDEKEKETASTVEAMEEEKDEKPEVPKEEKSEEPEKVEPKEEPETSEEAKKDEKPLSEDLATTTTKEEPEIKTEDPKEEEKMETDGVDAVDGDDKKESDDDVDTKPSQETTEAEAEAENSESDNEEEETDLKNLYPENYQAASSSRRLRINFRPVSDNDNENEGENENESDNEYKSDDNEIKKTIMVGTDYQAQIPEEFSKYDDALPYENKDKLVWDGCDKLSEDEILDYLRKVRVISHSAATAGSDSSVTAQLLAIPTGKHLRDDEQALFLLQQCGHDREEALRRRKIAAAAPPEEVMSAWSEEECRNFETGLRLYGKNFHQIQLAKVKTRSVGEIVQFYYLWKKSERHDVFASKARLDKKKYSLNPGQCIMDRFLEEQDGTSGNSAAAAAAAASSQNNQDGNEVQQSIPRNLSMPMCV